MTEISNTKTILLPDNRTLGYAEYGSPAGKPAFYFHGHPGSRFEAGFLGEAAAKLGLRLIGVDRPGLGLSTYQAGRRIVDWADDVAALADALHLDQFAVIGFSGGGPYALACAYKLSHRLTACGVVSGVGHISPLLSFLSAWVPWLILPLSRRMFQTQEQAEESLRRFGARWPTPDRQVLTVAGVSEVMTASLVEALRPGSQGAAYDGMLLGQRDWGFALEDIRFEKIYWWHGELDDEIPAATARAVAAKLAHCTAQYYPDEGHISSIVNHAEEILQTLRRA